MLERVGRFISDAPEGQTQRALLLSAIFVVFGGADFFIEWMLGRAQLHPATHGMIDGVIVGALAVLTAWFFLRAARSQAVSARFRIQQEAQLNHEIRNALEVIGQAGYMITDLKLKSVVSDSVKRIDRILRKHTPPNEE